MYDKKLKKSLHRCIYYVFSHGNCGLNRRGKGVNKMSLRYKGQRMNTKTSMRYIYVCLI